MMSGNISGYRPTITTNQADWQNVSAVIPKSVSLSEEEGLARPAMERSSRIRRAAPVDNGATSEALAAAAEKTSAAEQLNDLPVEHNSLIASRIVAVKRLLSDEAIGRDDEELLDLANQIHKEAQDQPDNQDAATLSQSLYAEECTVWGERNDSAALNFAPETVAQAYEEAWSMALNPPPPLAFQTRLELATAGNPKALVRKLVEEKEWAPSSGPLSENSRILSASEEDQIQWLSEHPYIVGKYYAQFADYIDNHLDRLCTAKALADTQVAGIGPLMLEYQPQKAWLVKINVMAEVRERYLGATLSEEERTHANVLSMPGGNFALVTADGSFKYLKRPASAQDDNWIWQPENKEKIFGELVPGEMLSSVKPEPVQISSLKDVLVTRIRDAALPAIAQWKKDSYNASTLEAVLRVIVPFYETAHNLRHDPGYQLTFGDVAWDVCDLAITLATIGVSTGLPKGVMAGLKAAKALQGASAVARASAGIRAALSGLKTGNFLLVAGKELTDFVIPVFTAKNLAQLSKKGSTALVKDGLSAVARRINMGVGNGAALLDRIYDSLYRTHHIPQPSSVTKAFIDQRAAQPIPPQLFRGQTIAGDKDFLVSSWGAVNETMRDDYLAACIRHSSRTGGSAGEVLSLTTDQNVAARFAKGRQNSKVLSIDTTTQPGSFRNIEDILKNDGPRLVQSGKISAATLASAVKHCINQAEKEVFYVMGSIPDSLVTIKTTRTARAAQVTWG